MCLCIWRVNLNFYFWKTENLPGSTVIVSFLHQMIDVGHPNFLDVVPLDVLVADLSSHQCLLVQQHEQLSVHKCRRNLWWTRAVQRHKPRTSSSRAANRCGRPGRALLPRQCLWDWWCKRATRPPNALLMETHLWLWHTAHYSWHLAAGRIMRSREQQNAVWHFLTGAVFMVSPRR